ncbi:tetraketide alpha-pyrone reductase 1 [Phtheirospermum japonicum]|uniref:Dihydroflavonol 4-reductase n=1 Tax=Phtheirospermum japonicum TaxID=374723 RepID=A0A830C5N4_9LAMI|nr:tetraketide alpha-pyrone reductase 1 [Phtheirospermum japonicum]
MGKVVCVTGASGYIASWLVKLLLHRGYSVKATVRNLSDPKKVEHLVALEGAEERLKLFEANLVDEGSFDSVVDGCEAVFHTASPVFLKVSDPQVHSLYSYISQTELIDPAVNGTINVLRSCKKASSIKRVVVTSSMASVIFNSNPLEPGVVIDETWVSDPKVCEDNKEYYALSKTLAEKAAWKFAEENGLDLVTLHPGYVIGPLLQPTLNFTSEAIVSLIKEGKELFPNGVYRYVDVRDVALAHILAFEESSASGRYLLVGRVTYSYEALHILNRIFPSLNLNPNVSTENQAVDIPYKVSQERAKSLGLNFTPLEVSLKDIVESLRQKKFLSF